MKRQRTKFPIQNQKTLYLSNLTVFKVPLNEFTRFEYFRQQWKGTEDTFTYIFKRT